MLVAMAKGLEAERDLLSQRATPTERAASIDAGVREWRSAVYWIGEGMRPCPKEKTDAWHARASSMLVAASSITGLRLP